MVNLYTGAIVAMAGRPMTRGGCVTSGESVRHFFSRRALSLLASGQGRRLSWWLPCDFSAPRRICTRSGCRGRRVRRRLGGRCLIRSHPSRQVGLVAVELKCLPSASRGRVTRADSVSRKSGLDLDGSMMMMRRADHARTMLNVSVRC